MTNDNARAREIVDALDADLAQVLELQRGNDVKAFVASGGRARFLREPALRMARHFDLAPAFLVLDPVLGSLGIVEVALPSNAATATAAAVVQRHVDTATYARHLLLRDRDLKERKALSVELVLLTANESTAEQAFFQGMGDVLRQALRESDSLYHVGVGILCYSSDNRFRDNLRRAFPWLLKATRRWMQSSNAKPPVAAQPSQDAETATPPTASAPTTQAPARAAPPAASAARRLRSITLTNYRLPGTRTLSLADASVHLVHGPNGSGKSSIVEALELVSTGKVDRLEQAQEKSYDEVIRNRTLNQDATITLAWTGDADGSDSSTPRTVIASGVADPIGAGIEASSFRLDQPLMTRLIGKYPHERADEFLRAFFPEAAKSLAEYRSTEAMREAARPALLDLVKRLSDAKEALQKHGGWTRATTSSGTNVGDYPDVLNRWLERTAMLDLVQKHRAVRETVQGAERAGWSHDELSVGNWLAALGPAADLPLLARYEKDLRDEVNALQASLDDFKAAKASQGIGSAAYKVTAVEAKALNEACRWLFAEDVQKSYGLFGDKVVRVLNGGDAPTYGQMVIGGAQWAEALIAKLDEMIAACQMADTEKEAPEWPGLNPPAEYVGAREAQQGAILAGRRVSERFVERLRPLGDKSEFDGSLIAAINELMALFTPARWGYDDIDLPTTSAAGKVGVNLELGGGEHPVRAELHLNTAELNLFTVALFMLCAARVPKPLELLLFDDPLQNMDELTSTALARGLTKVVRLWGELGRAERLLLLFHGNDDLERFSNEIAAATYRLPWLSPSAQSETIAIAAENRIGKIDVQPIAHLFDKRPPA